MGHTTLFCNPPLMAYQRSQNLKDKLVQADIGPGRTIRQQNIMGSQDLGMFPCYFPECDGNTPSLATFPVIRIWLCTS